MIRFTPCPKPEGFEARVEVRGAAWLANNATGRPKDYWSEFRFQLADAFGLLCGYSAMYEPNGTVDHFVSCDEDRAMAYVWSNYRYCAGWINSSKQNLQSHQVIDPFDVEDGWFEVQLPSMQLVVTDRLPEAYRERAKVMLGRLHLGNDERVLRLRREWLRMYEAGLPLVELEKKAPLIARAVRKQQP
ncbi:MAG: hypothetical protein HQM01_09785 [Magnetococcales bacterium]|nr:hypothetical protein [Magnetococcales bacterium]